MTDIDLKNLDRRVADRLIRRGELAREDWEKHLTELEDLSEQAEAIATRFETGVSTGEPTGR